MNERWLPVVGQEGKYEVSDLGRVRSVPRKPKYGKCLGGLLALQPTKTGGYLTVGFSHGAGGPLHRRVHQVVLEAFVGPCPDGSETRHLNGIGTDNRLENLCWGTPEENTADKFRHGTVRRGENQGSARLTEGQVLEMRQLHAAGTMGDHAIARAYGVEESTARRAIFGRTWKHLPFAAIGQTRTFYVAGEAHPSHKLSADEVRQIRKGLGLGLAASSLARAYGVSFQIVSLIKHNKVWRQL